MRDVRRPFALLLAAAALSCSDGVGPDAAGVPVAFSLHAPMAVSQAETDALGAAFDAVDTYDLIVEDSLTGSQVASASLTAAPGPDFHDLTLSLPTSTVGLAVRVTVIGRDAGTELYRASVYLRVQATSSPSPLALAVRYTGPGLRGTVRDQAGNGLANVSVELHQGASQLGAVTTEPDGTYLFLPQGSGGLIATGTYQVLPVPPTQAVCPAARSVNVATATDAVVADFVAQSSACQVDLLVLMGGNVQFAGDTATVRAIFANTPGVTTSTFFFLNQAPTLAALQQFDVVLLFANGQFNLSTALGTRVHDYVQAGGNVVVSSFYWQNRSDSNLGATGWGALETIDPFVSLLDPTTGAGGATYSAASLNANLTVAHGLTSGLNTLSSTGFRGGVAVASGATAVAWWDDGHPLVGYRVLPGGQRLVGVSLFPASGPAASGDTQALWENAVRWAGLAIP